MIKLSTHILLEGFNLDKFKDFLDVVNSTSDTMNNVNNAMSVELSDTIKNSFNHHDQRRIESIINELVLDDDFNEWYNNNGTNLELRKILARKLDSRDVRYLQTIMDKITEMK